MTAVASVADFGGRRFDRGLQLGPDGAPHRVVTAIHVGAPTSPADTQSAISALSSWSAHRVGVVIGISAGGVAAGLDDLVNELDCTLVADAARTRAQVQVADPMAALQAMIDTARIAPRAAAALSILLRQTDVLDVPAGLAAESAVYSTLLAGPEFASWRAAHPRRPLSPTGEPAVVLTRDNDTLVVELNRPERRNAFDRAMRDGLVDAFDLVRADADIARIELRGRGPAFGAGGDLDEFGTAPDVATAHLIRLDRSVGARIDACRDRVTAYLHGACIGSGIELPAFASTVVAAHDTRIRLPELSMGLVPGAGGTVSITRRAGRWRTAYLALTGQRIDAVTARSWGLVDSVHE